MDFSSSSSSFATCQLPQLSSRSPPPPHIDLADSLAHTQMNVDLVVCEETQANTSSTSSASTPVDTIAIRQQHQEQHEAQTPLLIIHPESNSSFQQKQLSTTTTTTTTTTTRTRRRTKISLSSSPRRLSVDFTALEDLGRGTYGSVIKVVHNLDRNVYAVKRLRIREDNSEGKLLREVSTLSRLSHPNVVRYYQAWIEDDYRQLEDSEDEELEGFESEAESLDESRDHELEDLIDAHEDPFQMSPLRGAGHDNLSCSSSSLTASTASSAASSKSASSAPSRAYSRAASSSTPTAAASSYALTTTTTTTTTTRKQSHIHTRLDMHEKCQDCQTVYMPWTLNISGVRLNPPKENNLCQKCFRMYITLSGHHGLEDLVEHRMEDVSMEDCQPPPLCQCLFIQMEYCELTLADVIASKLLKTSEVVWHLFQQIIEGLAYVHGQGILHRDLKPANIFITGDGIDRKSFHTLTPDRIMQLKIKLGDFGLAKQVLPSESADDVNASRLWESYVETWKQAEPTVGKARSGHSSLQGTTDIGTILYVPPDLDGMWDRKTDMYGVGVVLFEMLCPFNTGMERLITLHELRKPRTVFPTGFETSHFEAAIMIRRLLQPNADLRPSADELLQQVRALNKQQGVKRSDSSPSLQALSDLAAMSEADGAGDVLTLTPQTSTEKKTSCKEEEEQRINSLLQWCASNSLPSSLEDTFSMLASSPPINTGAVASMHAPAPPSESRSPRPVPPPLPLIPQVGMEEIFMFDDELTPLSSDSPSASCAGLLTRIRVQEEIIAFLQKRLSQKDKELGLLKQLLGLSHEPDNTTHPHLQQQQQHQRKTTSRAPTVVKSEPGSPSRTHIPGFSPQRQASLKCIGTSPGRQQSASVTAAAKRYSAAAFGMQGKSGTLSPVLDSDCSSPGGSPPKQAYAGLARDVLRARRSEGILDLDRPAPHKSPLQ